MSELKDSEELLLLTMDDQLWEFSLELDHPASEIVTLDLLSIQEGTGLTRTSTTSTDDDDLLIPIHFIHPERQEMEGDIMSLRNVNFRIFVGSTDIDEVDCVGSFFEKYREFARSESEHGRKNRKVEKVERKKGGKVEKVERKKREKREKVER